MEISQLFIYPVKSLRGFPISEAQATRHGFLYDRTFMLLKCEADKATPYRNMHLPDFPKMMLFTTALDFSGDAGRLTITLNDLDGEKSSSIDADLTPSVEGLESIEIVMHESACKGFRMGAEYDEWFSACFGFDVVFVYLGPSWRSVLMSLDRDTAHSTDSAASKQSTWMSTISSYIPGLGLWNGTASTEEEEQITFADCAPYLVCSQVSCDDVSTRLEGEEMQMVKFRPNIVVSGAPLAWEEDYWAEIAIASDPASPQDSEDGPEDLHISLPQNCGRCASINIDYSTGKPGTTAAGQALKRMQKDRRIDGGYKYSPVFGRYGFAVKNAGRTVRVGDRVEVVRRNRQHTKFDWPGLSTL